MGGYIHSDNLMKKIIFFRGSNQISLKKRHLHNLQYFRHDLLKNFELDDILSHLCRCTRRSSKGPHRITHMVLTAVFTARDTIRSVRARTYTGTSERRRRELQCAFHLVGIE